MTDPAPRQLRFFWFKINDQKFTHLDLTGDEVLALEQRFKIAWAEFRPVAVIGHRMAMLETFLARSDPEKAAARVGAMTMQELEDAVEVEWEKEDDLPDQYADGIPLADRADT